MKDICNPVIALRERDRVSHEQRLSWLRHVRRLVEYRYNGASRPLNVKAEVHGISYPTVYAISTARLDAAALPFSEEIPNTFVAKYVYPTLFGEREAAFSAALADSVGLQLYSTSSLEKTVEL